MLTAERFANYLMKEEGFRNYSIKGTKKNSRFRYKGDHQVIFLNKADKNDSLALNVAAHEVGHAIECKDKEKYEVFRLVGYIFFSFFILTCIFKVIFLIPLFLFGVIWCCWYARSEGEAEYYKMLLCRKYLGAALQKYNDNRDAVEILRMMEKENKRYVSGSWVFSFLLLFSFILIAMFGI